jgi:hypothetical protein
MSPFEVILIHILIQIDLQGFGVRINLLTESHSIEFIENRLVNPLTDPVRLGTLRLGLCMFDLIELQIELIGMLIWSSTELCTPVC